MKILVVDDEVIIGRALARAFESKAHSVTVAHSGEEGVEKWLELSPDVVLLDVIMPGLTGPQVIEEFKKRSTQKTTRKYPVVILMSAHSGVKSREPAIRAGADDFVEKPFENIFNLVEQIEKMVEEKNGR